VKPRYYVDLGRQAILNLLDREHALVWLEVEAKAADHVLAGFATTIDPHHLTQARRELREEGVIQETKSRTRGGREIPVLHLAELKGRTEAYREAAARKRLLQARFLTWAVGTKSQPGVIGPGGERVVHEALKVAAVRGYFLVNPDGRHITTLFGAPVPGGPLDGAAYVQVLDPRGRPAGSVVVLIEVKNVRSWIYPSSAELFQLLDKAARLQLANPEVSFLPLLVCRRAHETTFYAAHDLGFFVVDLQGQFMLPSARIDPGHLEEVRGELGYLDLVASADPPKVLVKRLTETVPARAQKFADQWRLTATAVGPLFQSLRDESLPPRTRLKLVSSLRDVARSLPGARVSW
jgi:hypothetical protein